MDKKQFQKLIEILDEEIREYTNLKDLFAEKRELLKKSKSDDLGVLDNKILALNEKITKLNKSRETLAQELTGKFAQEHAPEYMKPLEERKVKICNIIPEITLLNNQNVELLKHGIIITNKMLETIIDAFAPQGSYYNETGKTDTHDVDMWTISKEI